MLKLFKKVKLAWLSVISVALVGCSQIQKIESFQPAVRTAEFKAKLEVVAKAPFRCGNSAQLLVNGDSYFPSMLADIRAAKKTITFESFIMMKSGVTNQFVQALSQKVSEGVKVKLLLDAVGSRMLDDKAIENLKKSGIELVFYRPIWRNPLLANNRTHRKLLIIDGRVAYTGGSGFADAWKGNGRTLRNWRDNQYRITGPVVADMQRLFAENWMEQTGEQLLGVGYYPVLKKTGKLAIQNVAGSPYEREDTVASSMILAILAARKEVSIEMAYTCPPKRVRQALSTAAKRGVRVRILSSGAIIDSEICRRCAHNNWRELIESGVEVYEYQPAMMHAKLIVVDGYLSIFGAANMDYRSFFINDENNTHVLNSKFAKLQLQQFKKDLKFAKRLGSEDLLKFSLKAWFAQSQL